MWLPVTRGGGGFRKSWNSCDVIYGWPLINLNHRFLPYKYSNKDYKLLAASQKIHNVDSQWVPIYHFNTFYETFNQKQLNWDFNSFF